MLDMVKSGRGLNKGVWVQMLLQAHQMALLLSHIEISQNMVTSCVLGTPKKLKMSKGVDGGDFIQQNWFK
jgi:hypothetical protein